MGTAMTPLQTDWRQEWFEFEDATYLNVSGQSPMPRVSLRAVQSAMEAKKYPHHKPDSTFFEVPNRIRASIARLIGGKADEIALTSGASAGAAAVAYGLTWKPGDEIITAMGEFPLQYTVWKPMEEREGLKLKIVSPRDRFLTADDLIAAMTPKTRLVSVSLGASMMARCWMRRAWLPRVTRRKRCYCWTSANAAAPCRWTSLSLAPTFW